MLKYITRKGDFMKTYFYNKNPHNILDLYEATSSDYLILGLHGGSWIGGDKASLIPYSSLFTSKNINFASMNYRLGPKHNFDDMIDDINDALYFLSKKIKFKKVALFGISAGAHLCLLAAYQKRLNAKVEFVISEVGPTNFNDQTFIKNKIYSVGQFQLISSLTNSTFTLSDYLNGHVDKKWTYYSPITYVDENTPPTYLAYAINDQLVPYQSGLTLKDKLTKFNIDHQMITFNLTSHFLEPHLEPDTRSRYEKEIVEFAVKHFNMI